MNKQFLAFLLAAICLFAALPFEGALAESVAPSSVRISEVMSKNKATIQDRDGDFSDWIELENRSSADLDLTGWMLSKNYGKSIWVFPAFTLYANSRAVVFASKKDRADTELHASFAISEGDSITLLDNAGNPVSTCSIAADKSDYSLTPDENGMWVMTPYPTPGYENSARGYEAFCASRLVSGPLVINEVCVDNYTSYYHEVLGYSDWVEIKNVSSEAVDLSQYCLSDDSADPAQFQLSGLLYPGAFLVILCNKDAARYSGYMPMAPFSLNAEKEQIYLSTTNGKIVDYAALHEIPYKKTLGRVPGTLGFSYLYNESPGAENGAGERRVAAVPAAVQPGGAYEGIPALSVELKAPGEIYYTLDCSIPTAESQRYTGPITITSTSVLRAVSYENGAMPSRTMTATYFLNEGHTLPVVSLVADNQGAYRNMYTYGQKGVEVPGSVAWYGPEGSFTIGCGIKMNGQTSLVLPKKNMSLRFRGSYGAESLEYDLYGGGVKTFTNLVLRAGQDQNNTIVRNEVCYALAQEFSDAVLSERFRYCVLYCNGVYNGIYTLMEKPNEAMAASKLGVKKDDIEMEEASVFRGDLYNKAFTYIYEHDMSDPENYRVASEMIDMDSLIDWCILEGTFGNYDLQEGNLRYVRDRNGGRWKLMLYDLDVAFFHFSYCVYNVVSFGNQISTINNKLLTTSPIYRGKYLSRASEAYHGVLSEKHICDTIDRLAETVAPEVARDASVSYLGVEPWQAHLASLKAQINDGWIATNISVLSDFCALTPEEQVFYFGGLVP